MPQAVGCVSLFVLCGVDSGIMTAWGDIYSFGIVFERRAEELYSECFWLELQAWVLSSSAHSTRQEAGCWESHVGDTLCSRAWGYRQLHPDAFATFVLLCHFWMYTLHHLYLVDNVPTSHVMKE